MGVAEIGLVLSLVLLATACWMWRDEKQRREQLEWEISLLKEQLTKAWPRESDE